MATYSTYVSEPGVVYIFLDLFGAMQGNYWSLRPQNNLIKEYITFYCTLQALYKFSTGNNCLNEGRRTRGPKEQRGWKGPE